MDKPLIQESHFVPLNPTDTLHLRRIYRNPNGTPLFMLHGAIENGKIFYSDSGRGLAPFLARRGFDVYVGDLRGRGESRPRVSRGSRYGQTEAITEDIPALIDYAAGLRGEAPRHWIAHSWGGVLLSSFLARYPERCRPLRSLVYFGSKRCVRVKNLHRFMKVDLIWKFACSILTGICGYLPARRLKIGADDETAKSHRQSVEWVRPSPWIDSEDGFDYRAAIKRIKLPPIWYLAARNDHCLGHPNDVRDFMQEAGEQERRYTLLAKRNGNRRDYDHVTMLTHRDAEIDHFPLVEQWLREHEIL